jgi:DNA-binding transcriptional MerR regulator/tetratricopeptide (TPR) repeat protein
MSVSDSSAPSASAPLVSMKVIIQRSGMSRQTIHFYIRKGLLPKPRRVSRTHALYSQDTLDLLEIIKECQSRLRLSLDEIVKIMVQANYDPHQIRDELESRKTISRRSQGAAESSRAFTRDELLAILQPPPPPRWFEELRRRGLINARIKKYSSEHVELVRTIWELCQLGTALDDLQRIVKRIDEHAEIEFTEFRHIVGSGRAKADYPKAIRVLAAFDQFVLCKKRGAFRSVFFNKSFSPAERVVGSNLRRLIPSETFLVKMGLSREIDRLLHGLDRDPADMRSLQDLGRAYQMRSDWLILLEISEKILQIDPFNIWATADLCRAMCYLGRADEAVALLESRVLIDGAPLLKFRLGQCLVLSAHNAGVPELLAAVIRKETLTAEALDEARDDPKVRRWIMLDRALDNLSVSDPLRFNQPKIEELDALHADYESISDKNLSVLGRIGLALGKLLAAYALYLVYRREQHPKAELLRRKIVQMDPQCVLAAHSVHTLGTRTTAAKSKSSTSGSGRVAKISINQKG